MKTLLTTHENLHSKKWDKVAVMISGGKDSLVTLMFALAHFPKEKIVCVHAIIDIDWTETRSIVKAQCEYFGVELVEVQAIHADGSKKGFLSKLLSPRKNRKTGVIGQQKFPDCNNQWCTSELKIAPCDKFIRTLKGNILCLLGERACESAERAKLEVFREYESVKGRYVVKHSPIHQMSDETVWNIINGSGAPIHPAYSWGLSRASCAICIHSKAADLPVAVERAPEIVRAYLKAESQMEHSYRYKPATKKKSAERITVADLLEMQGVDVQAFLNQAV